MLNQNAEPTMDLQEILNTLHQYGGGTVTLNPTSPYFLSQDLNLYSNISIIGNGAIINFQGSSGSIKTTGTGVYTTGTITSITSGVNVTGSGTLWLAHVIPFVSNFFINGQWMLIAAVTSNTTMILAEGYDGPPFAPGASYRIATPVENIILDSVTIVGTTGTAISLSDSRFIQLLNTISLGNNMAFDGSYITECALNGFGAITSISDGIRITNGGRFNWTSVNSVSNGGSGLVFTNTRSFGFTEGVMNSNAQNGFTQTNCIDSTFNAFDITANGAIGLECVSESNGLSIMNGAIRANASDGIKFTATTDKSQLTGNVFEFNGGYGVNIDDSTCDNNILLGNIFDSNSSGAVNDSGTGTLIRSNIGVSDN